MVLIGETKRHKCSPVMMVTPSGVKHAVQHTDDPVLAAFCEVNSLFFVFFIPFKLVKVPSEHESMNSNSE